MLKDCQHRTIQDTQICPECPKPDNWTQHAQCLDHDPELWFPQQDDFSTINQAIKICVTCPVRGFCLEVGWNESVGIWGSFTPNDRIVLRKLFKLPKKDKEKRHTIRTIAHRL